MSSLRERKPHRFTIGNETLIVRVRESARARTKRIIVGPRRPPEVIVPRGTPDADVDPLLEERRGWVERKVSASREIAARPRSSALSSRVRFGSPAEEPGLYERAGRTVHASSEARTAARGERGGVQTITCSSRLLLASATAAPSRRA
jgi:predicted metal-dependent hydrolase